MRIFTQMNIIIFGPPLSGKGTQSKHIINDLGLTHLSTGDALRIEREKGSELGLEAAKYSVKGLLAPDDLVSKVVEAFYQEKKSEQGMLFDGYPRNVDQAKHLLQVLSEDEARIDLAIVLSVSQEELLQRAKKRAEEQNRADDKDSEVVIRRIGEFSEQTIPAINYVKQTGVKTLEIDGNQTIEAIYKEIRAAL